MYKEMIDSIELDLAEFSKKITYENSGGKILVKYILDFPPHSGFKTFDKDKDAKAFINNITKEGDITKYK